jgi:uncharacterized protein YbjT (DUF2867 family)
VAPTVVADYADVAALRAALSGVDTLVFVSSDGEAAKVLVHHENVVRVGRRRSAEDAACLVEARDAHGADDASARPPAYDLRTGSGRFT